VKPEVPKSWTLEMDYSRALPELRVLALTKGHVGSGNEIAREEISSEGFTV